MTTRGAVIRVGAVISSVVLVVLYVAYRSHESATDATGDATADATPATASPASSPATPVAAAPAVLPGSKSAPVIEKNDVPVVYADSPAVAASQPAPAADIRLMSSSKSAAVIDRSDARRLTQPATQPAR
jgi:hypothetical protein